MSLIAKGYVERRSVADYKATEKGKSLLNIPVEPGSDGRQGAYRGSPLSHHSIRFELNIKERGFFHISDLSKVGEVSEPVQMQGWEYHRVQLVDCNFSVMPNKVVLYIDELVDRDVEQTQVRAINRAIEVAQKLKEIGLIIDGIVLEHSHYARVKSLLADILVKKFGKYHYTLPDGTSFWIDFSGNKLEDETDSARLRDRIDTFIGDLPKSDYVLSDVGPIITDVEGLKQVAHMMLNHDLNVIRMQQSLSVPQPMPRDQRRVNDYVG